MFLTTSLILAAAKQMTPTAARSATPWWEWTIPTFNTRETAISIWAGATLLAFLVWKRDIRQSVSRLIEIFFDPWLLGPILLAAAYATLVVLAATQVIGWSDELTKIAAFWFFGFAFLATLQPNDVDAAYYRRLALRSVRLAVVIEFISNLHTLPLPLELALVPTVFLLAGVTALPGDVTTQNVASGCVTLLGLSTLVFALVFVVGHSGEVVTAEKGKAFVLPILLTVIFLPFFAVVRLAAVYQTTLGMTAAGIDDPKLYAFARRRITGTCRLNLGKIQLFESKFRGRLWGASTRQEVEDCIDRFERAWSAGTRVNVPEPPNSP